MPQRPESPMPDLVIDVAPMLRYERAMKALGLSVPGNPADFRQAITEGGIDPARAVVAYLEELVSGALEAPIDHLTDEAAGRVLLAEELLVILTGSHRPEAVRAWLQAPGAEERKEVG